MWAYGLEATAINHFIGSGPFARALRHWAHFHVSPAEAELCDKDDQGRCLARGFKLSELVRPVPCSIAAYFISRVICPPVSGGRCGMPSPLPRIARTCGLATAAAGITLNIL